MTRTKPRVVHGNSRTDEDRLRFWLNGCVIPTRIFSVDWESLLALLKAVRRDAVKRHTTRGKARR